jgi:hypothetical protein
MRLLIKDDITVYSPPFYGIIKYNNKRGLAQYVTVFNNQMCLPVSCSCCYSYIFCSWKSSKSSSGDTLLCAGHICRRNMGIQDRFVKLNILTNKILYIELTRFNKKKYFSRHFRSPIKLLKPTEYWRNTSSFEKKLKNFYISFECVHENVKLGNFFRFVMYFIRI